MTDIINKYQVEAVLKRKRIAINNDNSGGDDHVTDIILEEQPKQFPKENEAGQARLIRLEAAVDKLMQQSYQKGSLN